MCIMKYQLFVFFKFLSKIKNNHGYTAFVFGYIEKCHGIVLESSS